MAMRAASDRCQHSCNGKRPYGTVGEAERAVTALCTRHGYQPVNIFRCRECGQFHIGRKPKRERSRRREARRRD
ncbi:hypothetical protein ACFJGW_00550 [Burkholderiaceae bacterium UC74_6]